MAETETPDEHEYELYDPCPNCGQQNEFSQEVVVSEVVNVDVDGSIQFSPDTNARLVHLVECPGCGELLRDEGGIYDG